MTELLIHYFEEFVLLYFVAINLAYILLSFLAFFVITRYMKRPEVRTMSVTFSGVEPPVSVLMPAYNEEANISSAVYSILQLHYSEHEVLVINDGSKDKTLEVMIAEFDMIPFPGSFDPALPCEPVLAVYQSRKFPNLRLVDKKNGGKADALNAGINASSYPFFCAIDADSILQNDSLYRMVQPYLENEYTIATGGVIRVANGCEIRSGFMVKVGTPSSLLALFQVVEYLRAFLFGRLGWSPLNALLIVSGAFGLFKKEAVIRVGGYLRDTIGEDMELVVRMHRFYRTRREKYAITFIPDPVAYTEVPEDWKTLHNQRVRWQRGLMESLEKNFSLLFHWRSGLVGWLAFPFFLFFEGLGPLIEVLGYVLTAVFFASGKISLASAAGIYLVAISLGIMLSVTALLLEELSFHLYPRLKHVFTLFGLAVLENFGYRQINSYWRIKGLFLWAIRYKKSWGQMKRVGSVASQPDQK